MNQPFYFPHAVLYKAPVVAEEDGIVGAPQFAEATGPWASLVSPKIHAALSEASGLREQRVFEVFTRGWEPATGGRIVWNGRLFRVTGPARRYEAGVCDHVRFEMTEEVPR